MYQVFPVLGGWILNDFCPLPSQKWIVDVAPHKSIGKYTISYNTPPNALYITHLVKYAS